MITVVAKECHRCGDCQVGCTFLQKYGHPGEIAEQFLSGVAQHLETGFFCSLCTLCESNCPKKLPIAEMMLELRRNAVVQGHGKLKEHRPLRIFQTISNLPLFISYRLPENCDTIFFPGCALPAIRPKHTLQLFHTLQQQHPNLGIVLDCCNKPSHDLGMQRRFQIIFSEKLKKLRESGVSKIITACPSCLQLFKKYAEGIAISIPYGRFPAPDEGDKTPVDKKPGPGTITMHDPCSVRFDDKVHQAVRKVVEASGYQLEETENCRQKTQCCGEGGGAAVFRRANGGSWPSSATQKKTTSLPVITYCAGCALHFGADNSSHLIDLLYPEIGLPTRPVKSPRTYLNRLIFKLKIRKSGLVCKNNTL